MKLNIKALTLLLSAGIVLSLTGCGSSSSSSNTTTDSEPAEGELGYQTILEDGSIEYVDYVGDGHTRIAPPSAADAEYHTGVDFNNTLFDSADKKCQNCHNELYDTWKSSMHGKSWVDPIFQSKFQDFLRTHINKIDENKTTSGTAPNNGIVYTEAMIPKVAQTCIKCHAPGAYYAGDFKATLTTLNGGDAATTADLDAAKLADQSNLASATTTYDPTLPASVVAVSHTNGKLYQLTYQIGHEANLEGINCAFCHSIETPRLMRTVSDGAMDNETYTLANTMRVGPHGPVKNNIGDTLGYDVNASSRDMNHFFRLWGPEKYADYHATPKGGTAGDFDVNKTKDGRYTMTSKDINGTDGKVHFTGGPFYGPFGVTGISNENTTDETDRAAHVNPHFDRDGNNHFSESGKGLCLSCHQRSAGASLSGSPATNFMELCSTQIAVSTNGPLGQDNGSEDTLSSPKCQKCHMERIEGTVLHKWARPDLKWTLADNDHLTAEFNPDDTTVAAGENPVRDGWLNSHAFLGASKTGHKTSATAKIQSGFDSSLEQTNDGTTLTVKTTLTNKTAHMFPGAHPMRRVLTRVIVTSDQGVIEHTVRTGISTFTDIENTVQPLADKELHSSTSSPVLVQENGSADLNFPGKVADLEGTAVPSEKFDGQSLIISGTDYTITNQVVKPAPAGTEGNVTNAAIVDSAVATDFTRIYGHETGKEYNNVFVVRPGFDSNMVGKDNRLSPNETETYTLTYDIATKTGIKVEYRVYYMQKGANGKFPKGSDGFLKKLEDMTDNEKKLLITEVASHIETL